MQRPGAVTNCTMKEYSNAIVEQEVVMNQLWDQLNSLRVDTTLIISDDDNDAAPLFILKGSRAIHKIGNIETYLQDKSFHLPHYGCPFQKL